MTALTLIVSICLALVFSQALHDEHVPLRGFQCKQNNAQRPCERCEPGYYCPSKFEKLPCGAAHLFCELGSVSPTQVSEGHYTIDGDEEHRSNERICEVGFYCENGLKHTCTAGFYCPQAGMTTPIECGDASLFCNEGSIQPHPVSEGYYTVGGSPERRSGQEMSPLGHYAKDGLLYTCPEGHYGGKPGLADDHCSGNCEEGWHCPSASTHSKQIACGGEEYFCPKGSSSPQKVKSGYYTSTEWEPCRPGMYRGTPHDDYSDSLSPVNQTMGDGKCVPCPEGTFKITRGDSKSDCVECGPKAESTPDRITCVCYQSATQRLTSTLYFDVNDKQCLDITNHTLLPPDSMYESESHLTKSKEHICEKGSYCIGGVRYLCPAGRYGSKEGDIDPECTGPCKAGYYCPLGSSSPTQIECGDKTNVYCPESSDIPTYVNEGYYANEDDPTSAKTSQELCPPGYYCPGDGLRHTCQAGFFGENTGLTIPTCDGICQAGYYCPSGSTFSHQVPCGNATVVCTEGSSEPQPVLPGYYSASSLNNDIQISELSYAGPNSTQDIVIQCEIGHYCKEGVKYQCPGGTYGENTGADDASDCHICPPGYYCPSYPGPPTTNETLLVCGESYRYCDAGSPKFQDVDVGHYGISNNIYPGQANDESLDYKDRRTGQERCPPGYYCQLGLRHKCPPGTYGEKSGLVNEYCSGLCPRGYFCPENTVNPLPCSPGAYSSGGAAECTSCEVPLTVTMEKKNRMCRNDRSCCLSVFEENE